MGVVEIRGRQDLGKSRFGFVEIRGRRDSRSSRFKVVEIRGHCVSGLLRFGVIEIRGRRDSGSSKFKVVEIRGHRDSRSSRFGVVEIRGRRNSGSSRFGVVEIRRPTARPPDRPTTHLPACYAFGWIRKLFQPFSLIFNFFAYDTFFLKIHTGQTNRPKQFFFTPKCREMFNLP